MTVHQSTREDSKDKDEDELSPVEASDSSHSDKTKPSSDIDRYDWDSNGFLSIGQARDEALTTILDAAVGNRVVFPTGYEMLDDILVGGLLPGKLYIIGGRPGAGKSMFSNELLFSVMTNAAREKKKVIALYWTFEMRASDQIFRMIMKEVQLGIHDLYSIDEPLGSHIFDKIREKTERYMNMPVMFRQVSTTISKTLSIITDVCKKYKDYTIINLFDHSRLFSKDNERNEKDKLVNLTQGLIKVQQRTNCINILLSQLNREMDNPANRVENHKPKNSYLFGSDSLGQEAHCIMLINRPKDMYNISGSYFGLDTDNLLAIHVTKNRSNKIGIIPFDFNPNTLTIQERRI